MLNEFDLRLLDVDGDTIEGEIVLDGAVVAVFMSNVSKVGRVAELRRLHVDGAGPNTLGPGRLQRAMRWLMDQLDVDEILVEGGRRVTGAARGPAGTGPRTPSRLSFTRESK